MGARLGGAGLLRDGDFNRLWEVRVTYLCAGENTKRTSVAVFYGVHDSLTLACQTVLLCETADGSFPRPIAYSANRFAALVGTNQKRKQYFEILLVLIIVPAHFEVQKTSWCSLRGERNDIQIRIPRRTWQP
jgi:hypothetical protein